MSVSTVVVDIADGIKIRQSSGLGTLAAVEQQAAPLGFHHEGCRLLGAEAGDRNEACGAHDIVL